MVLIPDDPSGNPDDDKPKGRLHLMLIEDDPLTAKQMTRLLEAEGYAVRAVGSYKEALRTAGEWLPDLLVSDIGLPGKDGLEAMKTLRRAHPSLKGLVVSGYSSPADLKKSHAAGFAAHLPKPVNVEHLLQALKRLLS